MFLSSFRAFLLTGDFVGVQLACATKKMGQILSSIPKRVTRPDPHSCPQRGFYNREMLASAMHAFSILEHLSFTPGEWVRDPPFSFLPKSLIFLSISIFWLSFYWLYKRFSRERSRDLGFSPSVARVSGGDRSTLRVQEPPNETLYRQYKGNEVQCLKKIFASESGARSFQTFIGLLHCMGVLWSRISCLFQGEGKCFFYNIRKIWHLRTITKKISMIYLKWRYSTTCSLRQEL